MSKDKQPALLAHHQATLLDQRSFTVVGERSTALLNLVNRSAQHKDALAQLLAAQPPGLTQSLSDQAAQRQLIVKPISNADVKAATERGKQAQARGPLAVSARYESGVVRRIAVELDNGWAFAFPVNQVPGLAEAGG